jgi:hypothetical protein
MLICIIHIQHKYFRIAKNKSAIINHYDITQKKVLLTVSLVNFINIFPFGKLLKLDLIELVQIGDVRQVMAEIYGSYNRCP